MRVVLSNQAEIDLEEIGDYIAADNPVRALSFVRELRDHFHRIAKAPLAYAQRPELGDGVRSCTHGNYLILFIPDESESSSRGSSMGDESLRRFRVTKGRRLIAATTRR